MNVGIFLLIPFFIRHRQDKLPERQDLLTIHPPALPKPLSRFPEHNRGEQPKEPFVRFVPLKNGSAMMINVSNNVKYLFNNNWR